MYVFCVSIYKAAVKIRLLFLSLKNEYLISHTILYARTVYTYHYIKSLRFPGCCLNPSVILWLKANMYSVANKAGS